VTVWIDHVPFENAGPDLRAVYEAIYKEYPAEYAASVPALERPESIVAAHSLIPEAMRHLMTGLAVLLKPDLPLTRRQHEMIAAVVSVRNQCFY
jgi:hypothetical protein